MSKLCNASIENAAMERREVMNEKPQDRYAGRLKFTGCSMCGGIDGMHSVHKETLAQLSIETITLLAPWYLEPGNSEYLFHACQRCNRHNLIPGDFMRMWVSDIQAWLNRRIKSMTPDYAALAAEEPVLASLDSRESAGMVNAK